MSIFTACNRTYYGYSDRSYELSVPSKPSILSGPSSYTALPLKIPNKSKKVSEGNEERHDRNHHFYCVLSFVAAGRKHGDIVQISFITFNVGHFNWSGAKGKFLIIVQTCLHWINYLVKFKLLFNFLVNKTNEYIWNIIQFFHCKYTTALNQWIGYRILTINYFFL